VELHQPRQHGQRDGERQHIAKSGCRPLPYGRWLARRRGGGGP
jgi:hypothetical protein